MTLHDRTPDGRLHLRLAVVAPFHGRHAATKKLLKRLLVESTRQPDELWIIAGDQKDYDVVEKAMDPLWPPNLILELHETPRDAKGKYLEIPYSRCINHVLDKSGADVFCYLDNGSMPHPEKYRVMMDQLEREPVGAGVYVTQHRTGYLDEIHYADKVIANGYGQVNYTQVAHFRSVDRWPLEMAHANPDLADAIFWSRLNDRMGAFYPATLDGDPSVVLDDHHMPSPAAAGIA